MSSSHLCKDNGSTNDGKSSQLDLQDSNPFTELMHEVLQVLDASKCKNRMAKYIVAIFKKKQASIMSTTLSMWYKKYEMEALDKSRTQKELNRTVEANRILSAEVARFSSPVLTPTNKYDNTSMDGISRFIADSGDKRQFLIKTKTVDTILENELTLERFPSAELTIEGAKNCPLCRKGLHEVHGELEQKNQEIMRLRDLVRKMTHKGQILVSESNMYFAENARLESINNDLQETIRVLHELSLKLSEERNSATNKYLSTLKEKSLEIEGLNIQVLNFQRLLNSLSIKSNHQNASFQKNPDTIPSSNKARYEIEESSSNSMNRLIEEFKDPMYDIASFRKSLDISRKENFFLSGVDEIQLETPTSGLFVDEVSKIDDLDYITDKLHAINEISKSKGQLYSTPASLPEMIQTDNKNKNLKKSSNKHNNESDPKAKERCKKDSSKFNFEVQGRSQYEACRLI